MTTTLRPRPAVSWEARAWTLMRLSALLLVPLVWIHVLIQDIVIGVHGIDLNYVSLRWAYTGWRVYDAFLLSFAFAHGCNGLRQVIEDYATGGRGRMVLRISLLAVWLAITALGGIALIGGVR
jgi:succinate dehydrogenase / fumarate reductase membrane anchor subunit